MSNSVNPPPDPKFTFRGHSSTVTALCFNENAKELVSGSESGEIIIWSLLNMREKCKWVVDNYGQPHNSILKITYLQDFLVTQSRNGFVNIWEEVNGEYCSKKSYSTSTLSFCQIDLYCSDIESYLSLPSRENMLKIELLNLKTDQTEFTIDCGVAKQLGAIMCYKLMKLLDKFKILSGHEIGKIALWDFTNGSLLSELDIYSSEPIVCIEFDGVEKGICGSMNKKLVAWKLTNENKLEFLKEIEIVNPIVSVLTLRKPTETLKPILCAGCDDGRIRIFSWKTLKLLASLIFHSKGVNSATFCPKTGLLAAGSKDTKITLWSLYM